MIRMDPDGGRYLNWSLEDFALFLNRGRLGVSIE